MMPLTVQSTEVETARIADQLRRMYQGSAWHGPSLKELLKDVTEEKAARRPMPLAHSIWEIALHVAAWMRIGRDRLFATENRDPAPEENWPAVAGSWPEALTTLDREFDELERAILAFPDDRLNDPAPGTEPQTYYILMHGVIQHIGYHAGQIALLNK
jgi:uncharacterized damage-inducible protein DinB